MFKKLLFYILIICSSSLCFAQETAATNEKFEIGGIKISGVKYNNEQAIIARTGLKVGNSLQIPGPEVSSAIKALWELKLFTDVQILKEKTIGNIIFLEIIVEEKAQFAQHRIKGIKKSYHDDLNRIINNKLLKGSIVSKNIKSILQNEIQDYFIEKGFLDATCSINETAHPQDLGKVNLDFKIKKGRKNKNRAHLFHWCKSCKPEQIKIENGKH